MKRVILAGSLFISLWGKTQTWYAVRNNFHDGYPVAMAVWNNRLFAGGLFGLMGNTLANRVAQYDGFWYPVAGGTNSGYPLCFTVFNNELIAGGDFIDASGVSNTVNIAKWDGSQWQSVGNWQASGSIYALCVYNGELYAGGDFTIIGGVSCNRIAKWNGSVWQDVGGGVTGSIPQVRAMAVLDSKLYVAGLFGFAGGNPASCIASWNGTQWDSVGYGLNGGVGNLISDTLNNYLYASGGFNASGSTQLWGIGKWDTNSWSAVGDDTTTSDAGLIIYNNQLYACGYATTVYHGTDTLWYMARWDGTDWVNVSKFSASVETMEVFSGNLYAGGNFTQIDTSQIKYIGCMGPNCLNVGWSEQEKLERSINIYPNPTSGIFTVELQEHFFIPADVKVSIYNSIGKLLYTYNMQNKSTSFSISPYSRGLYFVRVESGSGAFTIEKIIVE